MHDLPGGKKKIRTSTRNLLAVGCAVFGGTLVAAAITVGVLLLLGLLPFAPFVLTILIVLSVGAIAAIICASIFIFAKKSQEEKKIEEAPVGEDWSWFSWEWKWENRRWHYKREGGIWVERKREMGQWFGARYGLCKEEDEKMYLCPDGKWMEARINRYGACYVCDEGKWKTLI